MIMFDKDLENIGKNPIFQNLCFFLNYGLIKSTKNYKKKLQTCKNNIFPVNKFSVNKFSQIKLTSDKIDETERIINSRINELSDQRR